MTSIFKQVGRTWAMAAATIAGRPLPFVTAAALLTATDLLAWKLGMFDGARSAEADRGLLIAFIVSKLLIIVGWLLTSVRLAFDPADPRPLRLGRRQISWLGGLLLVMPVALLARFIIQKLVGTLLAPIGPDPRTVLLLSVLTYLAAFLYLQLRLMPSLIGGLLRDREAGLGWSWRGTRGIAGRFVAIILLAMLPLFVLHFGNSLVWLPSAAGPRFLVLTFDGAVMAALLLTASASYVALYRAAKSNLTRQAPEGPALAGAVAYPAPADGSAEERNAWRQAPFSWPV